ncbi:isocitrate/isopropylmalate dehydrogenase family protein [Heyndrickxia coagulans]|uniref:isocitrate/isopropylmalate dehydrogenase family protein n=1 Tax=Heyndrickxia coagulans TaxID=1398 RepID=UPI002E1DE9C9|nr:isocitrate/isopropylmalate dehydrogenase family protein [Heyndrickxia coagulans]
MTTYKLGVLYGDGIGPEIVSATVKVLKAAASKAANGTEFVFIELPMGWEGIKKYNDPMPDVTKQGLKETDGWLMGPHDSSAYPDEHRLFKRNPSGELRHCFDLFANIRPSRTFPGTKSVAGFSDLIILRENSEGFLSDRNMYIGTGECMVTPDVALVTGVFTRKSIERIAHEAFKLAMSRRRKVTIVHKANVIRLAFGLFRDICYETGKKYYPEVKVEDVLIDAMAARLVRRAGDFDVIVTENLFGDILSDLAGELAGSLGLSPSLNTNGKQAMAQAAHGSAPDIAGQDLANPTSMLLSAVMLLQWLSAHHRDPRLNEIAKKMEDACLGTIADGTVTHDLGGSASTTAFTDAVIKKIYQLS